MMYPMLRQILLSLISLLMVGGGTESILLTDSVVISLIFLGWPFPVLTTDFDPNGSDHTPFLVVKTIVFINQTKV